MGRPINDNFPNLIVDALDQVELKANINRLWLGGVAGANGGEGQRPGGFIGQLIQALVTYDTTEAATLSGTSNLVDNLNHIRYRIAALETGGVGGGSSHVHSLARWSVASGVSSLELPDYAIEVSHLSGNGLTIDPISYSLIDYSQIVLDTAVIIDTIFTAQYILLSD